MEPERLSLQHARFSLKRGSQEDILMRKGVLAVAVTIGAALALAAPSFADTTVNAKASFTEGIPKQFGCTATPGPFGLRCGAGNMVPFGHTPPNSSSSALASTAQCRAQRARCRVIFVRSWWLGAL
jgi:hypothetical protein